MLQSMLSTSDNPYDPFDSYDEWYSFDTRLGYNTGTFLARIAHQTEDLGESVLQASIDQAIDEIVAENVLGLYIKVTRDVPERIASFP